MPRSTSTGRRALPGGGSTSGAPEARRSKAPASKARSAKARPANARSGKTPSSGSRAPGSTALVSAAREARTRAFARFSRFPVGAALEAEDGTVITGCNVENATYGLTVCAERVAVVKAISEGHSRFTRIAVVADTDKPTPPCGACRQILWEFGGNLEVILSNLEGRTRRYRMKDLLPYPFDGGFLDK